MALPLVAHAEGGTLGATVGAGDTGSGDPFDSVVGTPLITYDNTHAYHRAAYKVTLSATTTAQQLVWSTALGTVAELYGRVYVWSSANPATNRLGLIRCLTGGAQAARLIYQTDGTLQWADAGNAAEITTTGALPTAQWTRIEFRVQFVATNATLQIDVYGNADSTTPTETISTATAAGVGVNCDTVQIGAYLNGAASTWTGWLDNIQLNAAGLPGPVPPAPPPPRALRRQTRALLVR